MATTPRQQIASPQSFTSDPLEQVFAKQMGDATTGGYALANMITAGAARERGQDVYLQNLHQSNALAAALAKQDMESDLLKESLQQGHHYITAGVDPSDMPLIQRLFTGPSGNTAADLRRALTQSQIAENQAKAAHAGDAGADKVTYDYDLTTGGPAASSIKITTKNAGPGVDQRGWELVRRQTIARGLPDPGPNAPLSRGGGIGNPNMSEADQLKQRAENKYRNP